MQIVWKWNDVPLKREIKLTYYQIAIKMLKLKYLLGICFMEGEEEEGEESNKFFELLY